MISEISEIENRYLSGAQAYDLFLLAGWTKSTVSQSRQTSSNVSNQWNYDIRFVLSTILLVSARISDLVIRISVAQKKVIRISQKINTQVKPT